MKCNRVGRLVGVQAGLVLVFTLFVTHARAENPYQTFMTVQYLNSSRQPVEFLLAAGFNDYRWWDPDKYPPNDVTYEGNPYDHWVLPAPWPGPDNIIKWGAGAVDDPVLGYCIVDHDHDPDGPGIPVTQQMITFCYAVYYMNVTSGGGSFGMMSGIDLNKTCYTLALGPVGVYSTYSSEGFWVTDGFDAGVYQGLRAIEDGCVAYSMYHAWVVEQTDYDHNGQLYVKGFMETSSGFGRVVYVSFYGEGVDSDYQYPFPTWALLRIVH